MHLKIPEYPMVTWIVIVFSVLVVAVLSGADTQLGDFIGSDTVFPLVQFGILVILSIVFAIITTHKPKVAKKGKKRARTLKIRNNKE